MAEDTADVIVRALAAIDGEDLLSGGDCVLCHVFVSYGEPHEHAMECPWRRARAFVAGEPVIWSDPPTG